FGNGWWWMFYVSLAFAFLAKGPIGWIPLATLAVTKLCCRHDRRSQLSFMAGTISTCAGIILVLAIISAWGVPALVRTNGEFFSIGIGRHVVGRSLAPMEA